MVVVQDQIDPLRTATIIHWFFVNIANPLQNERFHFRSALHGASSLTTYSNEYLPRFHLHLVRGRVFRGGHRQRRTCADVELRSVTRTGDGKVAQGSLAERAAIVRADVVDAEELTPDVKHYHHPILDL